MHITQKAAQWSFRHLWLGANQLVIMEGDAEQTEGNNTETTCIPDGSWEGLSHFGSHKLEPLCCFVHALCFEGALDVHTAGRPYKSQYSLPFLHDVLHECAHLAGERPLATDRPKYLVLRICKPL